MANGFFVIERRNISNAEENISYFSGFDNRYNKAERSETSGIEIWDDDDMYSLRFETLLETKEWLNVLNKDMERYSYDIILMRFSDKSDFEERGEDCSGLVQLKNFFSTQEY